MYDFKVILLRFHFIKKKLQVFARMLTSVLDSAWKHIFALNHLEMINGAQKISV